MSLTISTRRVGRVVIIHVQGALTLRPALSGFQRSVTRALTGKSAAGLVLDLAGVSAIDSAGIGELVAVFTLAQSHGSRVAMLHVGPLLREMLAVTRVDGFFTFHDDEQSAVAAFN